ncbi:MAG TPA: hypothetical protein VMW65_01135, partial [Chloroflexota bacterium]|nr:hypothetical protein [Chloroflexota bacterium]
AARITVPSVAPTPNPSSLRRERDCDTVRLLTLSVSLVFGARPSAAVDRPRLFTQTFSISAR